ncbi:lactonase family protein [Mangrovihabitans endophyticus]|uniref:lactonase family protein n=1 Tax=Mangrovihabitans endophyticus TaxID=1751298 RepID=UPI001662A710|nr:lactonase family protein [Mangrovihabitans endophyticus]
MAEPAEFLYVGCYTGETGGDGEGVALLRRDPRTGDLTRLGVAARTPSPSFLAQHPTLPVLYACNELEAGTVTAFAVASDGGLTQLATRPTGGREPCHLAVTPDGRHLMVANYSSGSVAVHPLDVDGAPDEHCDLLDLAGNGPDAERQSGPHAHMVAPDPNGPDVLVCDLGSDRVWRSRLDAVSGRLSPPEPAVHAAPGTGPRHLLRSPDGALLLVGELAGDLAWYRAAGGGVWERRGDVPASTVAGRNLPSEVAAGRDGRFVYVANRGPDTVSTFAWDAETATMVAEVPTGGSWPRHMVLLGNHLYVANERSHTVTVFRIDPDTGAPQVQGDPVTESSPTCLLPWRRIANAK